METVRALLERRLRAAVAATATAAGSEIPVAVPPAGDPRFGDYQTNIAMALAKARRANPRQIAADLLAHLEIADLCEPPAVEGAGFINFRLRDDFVAARFAALAADDRLGVPRAAAPQRIVIDFSSPNVAKPMHVGHIRSTMLGDALARIARFLGHEVVTDNHLGDWGTQFGMVIYGWKRFRDPAALAADPVAELVRLYREVNALAKADEAVRAACRAELVKLQAGDPENLGIWRECVALSWGEFAAVYRDLGIAFDEHLGESFYNDRLAPLVDRLLAAGVAEESDGAICVFFRDDPDLAEKPCLIRKSDGGFLYATSDLATIEYRIARWQPDAIWYVVGAPQELHFRQVFAVARRLGVTADLRHIPFGSILGEDRKLMKTRAGDSVALRDLLAEARDRARRIVAEKNPALPPDEAAAVAATVGFGALKYAELSQYRLTDYVFAWDKLLSFQGNTAPYLQNAYVRIRSIFRKQAAGETGESSPAGSDAVAADCRFTAPAEVALAKRLCQFGEVVPQVLDEFRPNLLANYLYELATTFHGFYEECPVLKAADADRATRIALCAVTARVLHRGLDLLGIAVPDRM